MVRLSGRLGKRSIGESYLWHAARIWESFTLSNSSQIVPVINETRERAVREKVRLSFFWEGQVELASVHFLSSKSHNTLVLSKLRVAMARLTRLRDVSGSDESDLPVTQLRKF